MAEAPTAVSDPSNGPAKITDLPRWVAQRLEEDELSDDVGVLVLTSLEGDAALDEYLAVGSSSGVATVGEIAHPESLEPEPAGAFLRSFEVEGFRGVGERVKVVLQPQPGLTIISGRNGSGKSSLAEALEVALTGSTYRWKNKAAQWKEQWRNLHHTDSVEVLVQIAEEGVGPTTIGTRWEAGVDDVSTHQSWVQRPGDKRQPGRGSLGWAGALDTYRPMLSYDELGGLLEAGPSALYDALAKALGVEQITDAINRLEKKSKSLRAPGDTLAARRKSLLAEVEQLDDERANQAASLLKKTQPDSSALRALATGVLAVDRGPLGALRELESLTAPNAEVVSAAANNLRRAVGGMAKAGEAESARNVARLGVRRHALEIHAQFGDMTCPVCAAAELDAAWATSAREDVRRRTEELADLERASEELKRARSNAGRIATPRPAVIDRAPVPALEGNLALCRRAWDAWAAMPEEDLALADHLEKRRPELQDALQSLRSAASQELQSRHDAWSPIALKLASFSHDWDEWLHVKPTVDNLASALKWLKANDTSLKNERLQPIGEAARNAWSKLRQESNVDLGSLTLEGTATRRRVAISATVDGADAGALAVMSQGELHALSLALFLPRASMADSPFRFVVLDDPVQAMDPAKVDGLVQLLSQLALTRQVIVLSHDDRLPAAARRGQVNARLLEVNRGAGSKVTISNSADPAQRYLSDAAALLRDEGLPADTLRRTLPGLLRMAVEAAARDVVFERHVVKGVSLGDVEALWSTHHSTRDRVSLAIFDEVRSLDTWLVRGYRKLGLGITTGGVHTGLREGTDPEDACNAVRNLVKDIREGAKQ